jgi:hypothetical protein
MSRICLIFSSHGARLIPLGTAAAVWSIYQLVECELSGETEVLGEDLRQYHFFHNKSHID